MFMYCKFLSAACLALLPLLLTTCREKERKADPLDALEKTFHAYIENLPPLEPVDAGAKHTLLVTYVEDDSLPPLPEPRKLFALTEKLAREYLKLNVQFKLVGREGIGPFFARCEDRFSHPVTSYPIAAWHLSFADPELARKVEPAIQRVLRAHDLDLIETTFGPQGASQEIYISQIAQKFVKKNQSIYSERNREGKELRHIPALTRQTAYAYWDALLFQEKEVDFIITNTVLAAPDLTMPLYVINRGGITSGFVENNEYRPYRGAGMLALYPFLSDGPFFVAERGNLTPEEKLEAIAFLWLHELGHLLLRKQENYTLNGSIHRAAIDLNYKAWVESIKKHHKQIKEEVPVVKYF